MFSDLILYLRRNYTVVLYLALILAIGTLGFRHFQNLSVMDAFYMTALTVTTVGFREVGGEPDTAAKIFTVFMMFGGVCIVVLAAAHIGQDMVLAGERRYRERRERQIRKMKDHYIICGYGRLGRLVAGHLRHAKAQFVIVDINADEVRQLDGIGTPVILGDASTDETLEKAGVTTARGLVTVGPTDAFNMFVVLTARQLNPDIFILTRASSESSVSKLYRAGATKVVNPYDSAGSRIAEMLMRPVVHDFMEIFGTDQAHPITIEEIQVQEGSQLAGKALRDIDLRQKSNAIIVAIKSPGDSDLRFNPPPEETIRANDTLIAMAERKELNSLADMAK